MSSVIIRITLGFLAANAGPAVSPERYHERKNHKQSCFFHCLSPFVNVFSDVVFSKILTEIPKNLCLNSTLAHSGILLSTEKNVPPFCNASTAFIKFLADERFRM